MLNYFKTRQFFKMLLINILFVCLIGCVTSGISTEEYLDEQIEQGSYYESLAWFY